MQPFIWIFVGLFAQYADILFKPSGLIKLKTEGFSLDRY